MTVLWRRDVVKIQYDFDVLIKFSDLAYFASAHIETVGELS